MAAVKCPTCGTSVTWNAGSAYRPFCSVRCKNTDLGAWASERYTIADESATPTDPADLDDRP